MTRIQIPSLRHLPTETLGRRLRGAAFVLAFVGPGLAALAFGRSAEAAPPADRTSDLIAAVNAYRAERGMDPLAIDPILMLVSKRQNDYSMSIGTITHYGPDGSRPKEQAIAAGYGGGKTVFVSQNIQMGTGLTPEEAVQAWTGDEPHLNTMIGQYYRDVGAAAGEKDGMVYYTLMTGYVAGGYSARSTVPVEAPPAPVYIPPPVLVATPQADGSIVHIVQPGQVMVSIAEAYGVRVQDLVILNGLGMNEIIYAGDELTIRGALTPSPTATPSPAPTRTPTQRATPSPTSHSVASQTAEAARSQAEQVGRSRDLARQALIVVWIAVVVVGVVLAARRS